MFGHISTQSCRNKTSKAQPSNGQAGPREDGSWSQECEFVEIVSPIRRKKEFLGRESHLFSISTETQQRKRA